MLDQYQKLDDLSKLLDDLAIKQEIIDKKTKDAEEYKQLNNKLVKALITISSIFTGIIIVLIIGSGVLLNNVIDKYIDSNTNKIVTTSTNELTTDSSDILINSNGSHITDTTD